jgi:S1-C subfamily serine protease
MRFVMCLMLIGLMAGPGFANEPEYIDDAQVKRSIEDQAAVLVEQEKTVPNAQLQEQVAAEGRVDFPPPAVFEMTRDGEDLYDTVDDGVLIIARMYLCGRCDRVHANCASGFVVSKDGLAVTNHHVMENTDEKTITFVAMTRDGTVYPIKEVLASSMKNDLALIQLEGDGFTPVPIARTAEVGEPVHAVTNPSGRFFTYSSGEISRFFIKPRRQGDKRAGAKRVTVTSDYGGGSSGGPIFNDKGQVVAVVSEAQAIRDNKIVHYDSVPYSAILELFEPNKQARE